MTPDINLFIDLSSRVVWRKKQIWYFKLQVFFLQAEPTNIGRIALEWLAKKII